MTETEKIEYTRNFVRLLSEGINPLTGEKIPQNELLCHSRISNCLKYVTELLSKMQNMVESVQERPQTFEESQNITKAFEYSDEPLYIRDFAQRLNNMLLGTSYSKIRYRDITEWLLEIGMLDIEETDLGKPRKTPTELGKELGIIREKKTSGDRVYYVTKYTRPAQEFLVEHVQHYIDFRRKKRNSQPKPELQGTIWTRVHEEILVDLFQKGVSLEEIAITLKRTRSSIRTKLRKLGQIE